jgi:hypothetical protein
MPDEVSRRRPWTPEEPAPGPFDWPPFQTALRLTAVALLLRPMGPWFVRPLLLRLAVVLVVSPRALRSGAVWGCVAALVAIRIVDDWPLADNHIYLLGYWTLAIALALRCPEPAGPLAYSSRRLLGFAFLFAVLWKALLSPDFLDGRFFRVTLLTDPRFGSAAQRMTTSEDTLSRRVKAHEARSRRRRRNYALTSACLERRIAAKTRTVLCELAWAARRLPGSQC